MKISVNNNDIYFNDNHVLIERVKESGKPDRLVIFNRQAGFGVALDALKTVQLTRMTYEDKTTPKFDEAVRMTSLTRYGNLRSGMMINRIDADEDDSIRALYVNADDPQPKFIVANSETQFNNCDVGAWVTYSKSDGQIANIKQDFERYEASQLLSDAESRSYYCDQGPKGATRRSYANNRDKYRDKVNETRKEYIKDLFNGEVKSLPVGIFQCYKDKLVYTDTTITIKDKEAYKQAVEIACQNASVTEFEPLLAEIVEAARPHPVVINGTSVQQELRGNLTYINNRRISNPDVTTVIERVLCFPQAQDAYDDFVKSVSKISLKFHRANANGLEWRPGYAVSMENLDTTKAAKSVAGIRIPGSGGHGRRGNSGMSKSCKLQFNKKSGKRAEVFLFGAWRKLRDFDAFIRFLECSTSYNSREERKVSLASQDYHYNIAKANGEEPDAQDKSTVAGKRLVKGDDGKFYYQEVKTIEKNSKKAISKKAKDSAYSPFSNGEKSTVEYIGFMDSFLVDTDRVLPTKFLAAPESGGSYYYGRGYNSRARFLQTVASEKFANTLAADLVKMFQTSIEGEMTKLKRSHELLRQVMKETGAEEFQKGEQWWYRVTGSSGIEYQIREYDAAVYVGNTHVCVVRATNRDDDAGYDYITSLIAALHKDQRTAKKVGTLKHHVDKADKTKGKKKAA